MLSPVPSLADLIADPAKVTEVSVEAIANYRAELAKIDTLLLMRLLTATTTQNGHGQTKDRLLNAAEAAQKLGVSKDWIYANADALSPIRIGEGERKALLSEAGIDRFIRIRSSR